MSLFFNIFFGAIGSGYLIYAKRQHSARFMIFGFLLAVFPYFIENTILMFLAGAALAAAPFVMERLES